MSLSDYERGVLADLEKQLQAEAPQLQQEFPPSRIQLDARRVGIGGLGIFLGLLLLILGVHFGWIWLGLCGFIAMLVGALYALRVYPFKDKTPNEGEAAPGPKPANAANKEGSLTDFMARQNERWDKRKEQH